MLRKPPGVTTRQWKTMTPTQRRRQHNKWRKYITENGLKWDGLTPTGATSPFSLDEDGQNISARFIGVPGGREFNPNTNEYEGYLPGTPVRRPRGWLPAYESFGNLHPWGFDTKRPRYVEGDQTKPGGWGDKQRVIDLQRRMLAAGLYDPTAKFVYGAWGPEDSTAYRRVLEGANTSFQTDEEWLTSYLADPSARVDVSEEAAQEREPFQVKVTNALDIRAVLKRVSQELYGGELAEEQQQSFIKKFQDEEVQAARAAYDLGEESGVVPGMPGEAALAMQAENLIREQNAPQVFASALGDHIARVLPGIASPGGGWLG